MMMATETDIMALAGRVAQTRETFRIAGEARQSAYKSFRAAETVERDAQRDFEAAQNALVVAAGGTDRSFTSVSMWERSAEPALV